MSGLRDMQTWVPVMRPPACWEAPEPPSAAAMQLDWVSLSPHSHVPGPCSLAPPACRCLATVTFLPSLANTYIPNCGIVSHLSSSEYVGRCFPTCMCLDSAGASFGPVLVRSPFGVVCRGPTQSKEPGGAVVGVT